MSNAKTIKILSYILAACSIIALIFGVGHRFSEAPWTHFRDESRIVLFICVIAIFGLNQIGRRLRE